MKNKLILIILLNLLMSCKYKEINKPGLKGRIKEYTEYKIKIDNNKIKDTILVNYYKFNKSGEIVYNEQSYGKSNMKFINTSIFDEKGKIIKEIGHINNDTTIVEYFYKNDLLKEIKSKSSYSKNISEFNEKYFYDDKGKLTKKITLLFVVYKKDTISSDSLVYYYDKKELPYKLISTSKKISDTIKRSINKYEYNNDKLLIKNFQYDENDSLIKSDIYKYKFDSNGSWIEKKDYRNDTLVSITIRKIRYDENKK